VSRSRLAPARVTRRRPSPGGTLDAAFRPRHGGVVSIADAAQRAAGGVHLTARDPRRQLFCAPLVIQSFRDATKPVGGEEPILTVMSVMALSSHCGAAA
jgi:hypothetical protein